MNDATVSRERKRGCGFRKAGGLYLVGPGSGLPCGRLPMPLTACEACGQGIKQARGWTWVKPKALLEADFGHCGVGGCGECPLGAGMPERCGLIWIGHKFYPTPNDFLAEGARMGFSRRISAIPRGFKIGEDWILLAHRAAIVEAKTEGFAEAKCVPGIFAVWRPRAVQHVVTQETSQEEVDAIRKRGHEPVVVEPDESEEL